MLKLKPVGKIKAKNPQIGTSTLPKEFSDWPIPGPEETDNLVSLSPFKEDGIYYMRGGFSKQLSQILGLDKLPILMPNSELARLIMIKSHNFAHMSASDTAAYSPLEAWIVVQDPLLGKSLIIALNVEGNTKSSSVNKKANYLKRRCISVILPSLRLLSTS